MKTQTTRKMNVEVEVPITVDTDDRGIAEYLGQRIIVFCVNYIYSGILAGVNSTNILLKDGGIVYETGSFTESKFKDFQPIGHDIRINLAAIESFGPTNKR
jgi:hypothetical protein